MILPVLGVSRAALGLEGELQISTLDEYYNSKLSYIRATRNQKCYKFLPDTRDTSATGDL